MKFYSYYFFFTKRTSQIKTNLLTVLGAHLKYPLNAFVTKDPTHGVVAMENTLVSVRSLAEVQIAKHFQHRFSPYLESCLLTGDSIKILEHTHNSHPDVLLKLKNESFGTRQRNYDIKSGNIKTDEWFKGNIYELSTYKDNPIFFPNKEFNLSDHYNELLGRLRSETFNTFFRNNMFDDRQYAAVRDILNHPENIKIFNLIKEGQDAYTYTPRIEEILMEIQTIPQFPKACNFINVYKIKDSSLSDDEMKYLAKKINSIIDPTIFAKELHNLLGDKLYDLDKRGDCRAVSLAMLSAYQKTIDKEVLDKLQFLHRGGHLEFNRRFIEDFASLIKHHGNISHFFSC